MYVCFANGISHLFTKKSDHCTKSMLLPYCVVFIQGHCSPLPSQPHVHGQAKLYMV